MIRAIGLVVRGTTFAGKFLGNRVPSLIEFLIPIRRSLSASYETTIGTISMNLECGSGLALEVCGTTIADVLLGHRPFPLIYAGFVFIS